MRFIEGFVRYAVYRFLYNLIMRNKLLVLGIAGTGYMAVQQGFIDVEQVQSLLLGLLGNFIH